VDKSKYLRLLGGRLAEERARLGLTQAQVAEFANITRRTQINYETGERAPDAAYLKVLERKGIDPLYVVIGRRETNNEGSALRVAEPNAPYQIVGLKPTNVRAAAVAVLEAVFADSTKKRPARASNVSIDVARVAEAIVVLSNMSETVDEVKRNAAHVIQLLK
jgi:transcriptional regulator with XRE-family HTH domain